MRAGKLKTRRYKTHPLRGVALLLAGVLLGAGAFACLRGEIALPIAMTAKRPAQAASQAPSVRQETTLTLPSQSWYALQLGAFDARGDADALAGSFQGRGAAGYVLESGKYLVLAAAYDTRADAQSVQVQLKNRHQVDSVILEITRPEVTFHLTGNKENLDALRDALDALQDAAGQMSALSLSLDRDSGAREQVFAALQSERNTIAALRDRLQALFAKAPHPAVTEIERILDSLYEALDSAAGASSQSQLGARVKYCQLLSICRLASFAQSQCDLGNEE